MACHALAGKYAARILCHPGRARLVGRERIAVTGAIGGEVVALDHPGEALALRHAGNIHLLPYLENVDADFSAELEISKLAFGHAEFSQDVTGLDRSFGE